MMTHDQLSAQASPALSRWQVSASGTYAVRADRVTAAQLKAGCKLYLTFTDKAHLDSLVLDEERKITAAGAS